MSTAHDSDLFEESKLCVAQLTNLIGDRLYYRYIFSSKIKHLFTKTNLIDRQTTEDEVVCQQLCQSYSQCSNFTFVENKYPLDTGEPNLQCYLWKRCNKKVIFMFYPGIDYSQTCPIF